MEYIGLYPMRDEPGLSRGITDANGGMRLFAQGLMHELTPAQTLSSL